MKFTFIDASWRLALSRESSLRAKGSPHRQWNPLDSRIPQNPQNSRRIRSGTSGTTALVHVSMYKYVNMLWFFWSFCRAVKTTFFHSSRQNSRETFGADDMIGARQYRKGEGTSLPVFQVSVSQIILIVAPPIQHFREICEHWSCESESYALCQIQATLFWWSNLVKGQEAFDKSCRGRADRLWQTNKKQMTSRTRPLWFCWTEKEKLWKLGKRNPKNRVSERVHDACVCVCVCVWWGGGRRCVHAL